ncbi:ParB family chromosome partitioning protein [Azospirillum agricola]|uniref:ParB/RepB/Spo0J family partition protein n=1 Tax=Azospirillum agricola TaxID=1720247 RepID=UPI001AE184CA|nr:ParB/RepB/Spo0J family partition protein [Azospirillum agricola]MBP2231453.1 ParB family chromosome partitioning protein [Azospirillum agricola]
MPTRAPANPDQDSADLFDDRGKPPRLLELDVASISENPSQPRRHFDPDEMRSLADSIADYGMKQPILVQEVVGGYRLVAGERRLRAHRMLGLATIHALATSGNPDELALVENVQRVDLDALELAEALERLIDRYGYTQEQLGRIIGKSQSNVSHTLRLNTLPPEIKRQYAAEHRDVSRSTLIEIAWIKDLAEQMAQWEQVKAGDRTVQAARSRKDDAKEPSLRTMSAVGRFLEALRRATRRLGDPREHRAYLDDAQRRELLSLRRRIDLLLGDEEPMVD